MSTGKKRGLFWPIVMIVAVAALLFATRPTQHDHREKVKALCTEVTEQLSEDVENPLLKIAAKAGLGVSNFLVKNVVVDNLVYADDYYLFTLGKVKMGESERVISIGVLGFVITAPKDYIVKRIEETAEERLENLSAEDIYNMVMAASTLF